MTDTLSGDTQLSSATKSQAVTVPGGSSRSTVLPRVEWEGPEPKVSPTQRHRFEELGLLGEGGMGEVVLAKDHDIERRVAVKRLPKDADLGRVLRFVEEIRTVGQLEHPNIIPVHDVGVDDAGRYYFVMKAVEGETLEAIIARLAAGDPATRARYPMAERAQIFLSILHAMAHAHRRGFIHRDLKPANIMVGRDGEVTVMDWGLAKKLKGPEVPGTPAETSGPRDGTVLQTQLGAVMGTPLYMSPEQARGAVDEVDERTDIYALGVLFYEFLTLKHYLHGMKDLKEVLLGVQTQDASHVVDPRTPAKDQLPAALGWFIGRAMKKDRSQRTASVEEMVLDLQHIISGECRVQCPRTFAKRATHELGKLADTRPYVVISLTLFSVLFVLGSLVKAAFSVLP